MSVKVLALAAVVFCPVSVFAQEAIIVTQPNAPLLITSYEAAFQRRTRNRTEGIRHAVKYRSNSSQTIMASEIGLVSFSIFNEFLDRTGGISMDQIEPGGDDSGTWIATAYADFSFHTGVAYVNRVRFVDGTIWEADVDEVMAALREIEEDFDAARLTAKDSGRN